MQRAQVAIARKQRRRRMLCANELNISKSPSLLDPKTARAARGYYGVMRGRFVLARWSSGKMGCNCRGAAADGTEIERTRLLHRSLSSSNTEGCRRETSNYTESTLLYVVPMRDGSFISEYQAILHNSGAAMKIISSNFNCNHGAPCSTSI